MGARALETKLMGSNAPTMITGVLNGTRGNNVSMMEFSRATHPLVGSL